MIQFPNGSKRRAALRKGLALVLLLAGAWPLAAVLRAQVAAESRAAPLTAAASSLPARRLPIVAHRRYTMHGAIRPLYLFWIRRNDIGSAENIFEFETLRGPVFSLSAGWAEGLLGVSMKVSYARLEADRSKLHPLVIGIGVLLQHWDLAEGR